MARNQPFRGTAADQATLALANRVFSGLNPTLIPSVTGTFNNLSKTKLVDVAALEQASKALRVMQGPAVTFPQFAPNLGRALARLHRPVVPTYLDAMRTIATSPQFNFTKTLENLQAAVLRPDMARTLQALALPPSFTTGVATALRDLQPLQPDDLGPRLDQVAREAVALAEVEGVAETVDPPSSGLVVGMSPAKRRVLALDIAILVAAFLTLAACLSESGARDAKTAGAALACAAALIRVHWRVEGKLD